MNQLSTTTVENVISCTQHTLCTYCSQFLGKAIDPTRFRASEGSVDTLAGVSGGLRKFKDVEASVRSGCWICDNIVVAARVSTTFIRPLKFVQLESKDFSPNEIYVRGISPETARHFCHMKIHPIEKNDVPLTGSDLTPADYTWSENACETVQDWLRQCDDEHADCNKIRRATSSTFRPSRLLDLEDASSGRLKLVLAQNILDLQNYAALSHCWGDERIKTLVMDNLSDYLKGFALRSLPKTIVDAAKVCHDLEIRYLWVDSLCIIQDSKEDWTIEAPQMSDIYSNAFVTIAAAAAQSDSEGFVKTHNPHLVSPLVFTCSAQDSNTSYYRLERRENFDTFVNSSRLNTRAWVFQERALSRRILYFAEDQVYWQCPSAIQAMFDLRFEDMEIMHTMRPQWLDVMNWVTISFGTAFVEAENPITKQQLSDGEKQLLRTGLYLNKWNDLVEEYSQRNLTYTSDKLMAISGLATRICDMGDWKAEDYLAGHWRAGLLQSLLWHTFHRARGSANEVPSWSWASVNAHTTSHLRFLGLQPSNNEYTYLATALDTKAITTIGVFGSFSQGCITMQCHLCEVRLRKSIFQDFITKVQVRARKQWSSLPVDDTNTWNVYLDRQGPFYEIFRRTVFFMPIMLREFTEPDTASRPDKTHPSYIGLLLQPTGGAEGQFVRVGTMEIHRSSVNIVSQTFLNGSIRGAFFRAYNGKDRYTIDIV